MIKFCITWFFTSEEITNLKKSKAKNNTTESMQKKQKTKMELSGVNVIEVWTHVQ